MTKNEFLIALIQGLSRLPKAEVEERVAFYGEMIADRMEDGLSEEEAVASLGSVQEVINQIISEIPLSSIIRNASSSTAS